jgi:hypothetical protein
MIEAPGKVWCPNKKKNDKPLMPTEEVGSI